MPVKGLSMRKVGIMRKLQERILRILALEKVIITKPERLVIAKPATVLVIAPHSDDEVLGCGGLLSHLHQAGSRLNFLIVTNGSAGNAFIDLTGKELSQLRESETRAAAKLLGDAECMFLNEKDSAVKNTRLLRQSITHILDKVHPHMLLLPYLYDAHTDHRATTEATLEVLNDCNYSGQILMYEVWTPLPANKAIPINWNQKATLIQQYKSQLGEQAFYIEGAKSLARYRAMTCLDDPQGYAECFLEWQRKT